MLAETSQSNSSVLIMLRNGANKKINVKKLNSLKTVCNGDTAYTTQLKQQKSKKVLLLWAAHRHNVNVLVSNNTSSQYASSRSTVSLPLTTLGQETR